MISVTYLSGASLVAQTKKSLPAMQETWVSSLGREDPPGEGNGYSPGEFHGQRALADYNPRGTQSRTGLSD